MSVALAFALIGGVIASRLRLPVIVGYLLAGIAVGPFTPGFVADEHLAPQLAELGVILLMFGVGIHFSPRDLLAVRGIAIPGAVGQIVVATALTVGVAWWWGWGLGAGLVLGLAISVASTVVLLRALEERGALTGEAGRIAVGWLVVEDLVTVLALVLLPVLAAQLGDQGTAGAEPVTGGDLAVTLGLALGKVVLLTVLVLAVGTRVTPWLLRRAESTGSRELFTLAVLAVALGIAWGSAEVFDVSFALGAFLAGLTVAESDLGHRAAEEALPLRDAFAVLFFVSVGMLFEPEVLLREPGRVLVVLALIVVAKPLTALALTALLRRPWGTGLVVAAGLAQIGEFSFILAGTGIALGMLPTDGSSLILAGALLSITLNPLLFGLIGPLEARLTRRRGGLAAPPAPAAPAAPAATDAGAEDVPAETAPGRAV
jgi:CPA2 family monovalent cation:H+ antiporter-2